MSMKYLWRAGPVVLTLLAVAGVSADDPTVRFSIRGGPAFVNEATIGELTITNFESAGEPELPTLADAALTVLPGGSEQRSMRIINGRQQTSRVKTYPIEIIAHKTGELTIPPIAVRVDGRRLETPETRITVRASDAEEIFFIEITSPLKRVYVGQRIPLQMTFWVRPPSDGMFTYDEEQVKGLFSHSGLGPFQPRVNSIFRRTRPSAGGKNVTYYVYQFDEEFTPERAGPLKLDDIEVTLQYPSGSRARLLRPKPRVDDIEVRPLPMDGRPADFNGAVGIYDISVTAKPTDLRVGDPIELTIELWGDGPVASLPPPLLTGNPELVANFRLPTEALAGEMRGVRRRYSVIVRPMSSDVREIPEIKYSYFDPDNARYSYARSAPIPLRVSPAEQLNSATLTNMPTPAPAGENVLALDGLRDIRTDESALLANSSSITMRDVLVAAAAPPAAFAALGGFVFLQRRARSNPARQRRQAALGNALAALDRAAGLPARERGAAVLSLLAGYLADRMDVQAARFEGAAGAELLQSKGVSAATVSRWRGLISGCEQTAFGADPAVAESLLIEARACLNAAEGEWA